ncbi:MAG: RNA pseudouridine synthase [Bacteroidaceae bacterium]|nr:RNA pseudouridine synthase [Bacteroidaceae bacterium]
MQVLYEDNHLIIVSKDAGEIVQGDKTGDTPLSETVKAYIKERYAKPGQVFLGVTHRLDRPVSGVVVFARTSKALTRMNNLFRDGKVEKVYLAITANMPPEPEGEIVSWLTRNERLNKSFVSPVEKPGAKLARLRYRLVASSDHYHLIAVRLLTGRHHQIRCQLASIGCSIKGDLKYGAPRSNPDGSICLHAAHIKFEHPVSHLLIDADAPVPATNLWRTLTNQGQDFTSLY